MTDLTMLRRTAIDAEGKKLYDSGKELDAMTTKDEIKNNYSLYNCLTTLRQKQFDDLTIEKIKSIIELKLAKNHKKELGKITTKFDWIESAPDIVEGSIGVEWKRSYMWGNNPTAELKLRTEITAKNYYNLERFNSGSIGRCGYNKESTAIASVLNQSNAILKLLYGLAQEAIKAGATYRDFIGYGSGYGLLPYFEGGVGTSCYYSIFDKMGLKLDKIASGKTFDAWTITKK